MSGCKISDPSIVILLSGNLALCEVLDSAWFFNDVIYWMINHIDCFTTRQV